MTPAVEQILKLLGDEQALIDYCFERYADPIAKSLAQTAEKHELGPKCAAHKSNWWATDRYKLAFRLRDEAVKQCVEDWWNAQHLVVAQASETGTAPPLSLPEDWWADFAQPEHYIVAALVAQELKKEVRKEQK